MATARLTGGWAKRSSTVERENTNFARTWEWVISSWNRTKTYLAGRKFFACAVARGQSRRLHRLFHFPDKKRFATSTTPLLVRWLPPGSSLVSRLPCLLSRNPTVPVCQTEPP